MRLNTKVGLLGCYFMLWIYIDNMYSCLFLQQERTNVIEKCVQEI